MTVQEELAKIINSGEACAPDVLRPMWDQLGPVTVEEMIGKWQGGTFNGPDQVDILGWAGKNIKSREDVEPMLCRRVDGSIYFWKGFGPATMAEMKYGDQVSAAMIYDKYAMFDYFRKINNDLIMGITWIKGNLLDTYVHLASMVPKDMPLPNELFFWLRRGEPK